jgi:glyoxylase-like metal-dependent hydrolase (beta-lactamase superfamily II)
MAGVETRVLRAGNRGPFTLDGTRSFLVGKRQVAVIDPGPEVEDHLRALVSSLEAAREVSILLTHGHRDHSGGAAALAARVGAKVFASPFCRLASSDPGGIMSLQEGDTIATDQGELVVVEVPGHSRDHLAFHWIGSGGLFVGDLLLGRGNTTWIGEYPGCVADYLESLQKVRALSPRVLYPAHGPPITDPISALKTFESHRLERIEEVRDARRRHPEASAEELAGLIYGGVLPPRVVKAATGSVEATLHHLEGPAKGDGEQSF